MIAIPACIYITRKVFYFPDNKRTADSLEILIKPNNPNQKKISDCVCVVCNKTSGGKILCWAREYPSGQTTFMRIVCGWVAQQEQKRKVITLVFSRARLFYFLLSRQLFLLVHSIYVLHYTSQKRVYIYSCVESIYRAASSHRQPMKRLHVLFKASYSGCICFRVYRRAPIYNFIFCFLFAILLLPLDH